jgi:predicted O-methyltransferase YrrM
MSLSGAEPERGSLARARTRLVWAADNVRERAPRHIKRFISHPTWAIEQARHWWYRRQDEHHPFPPEAWRPYLADRVAAIGAVTRSSEDECRAALANLFVPEYDPDVPLASWSASQELMAVVGAVVRLLTPAVVIETGVARGFTSAVILATMRESGTGRLHSIELPPPQVEAGMFVGKAVPQELRDRWSLHLGPSRRILPGLLRQLAPIDVFLHDADHTYLAQRHEYQTVWPALRSGGVLLSDDVGNPAFVEFAAQVGGRAYLVDQPGKDSPVGLLRKP